MNEDEKEMISWLKKMELDAVVCSGSRRNVSIWEKWMSPTETLFRAAAKSGDSHTWNLFRPSIIMPFIGIKS